MATTLYADIYDFFMMLIKDYNLINLYNTSVADFNTYLQAWLIFAIEDFQICQEDLSNRDDGSGVFNVMLTTEDKTILALLMTKYWMTKTVEDIMQMNLHVLDKDFKVYSEAQNLTAKQATLNSIKERCSQRLQDYGYRHNSWTNWYNGDLSGGLGY